MLSPEMQKLITDHSAGMVATINRDGTPSVSPKATFVILDDRRIAFGNIRSPGTLANIRKMPAVEVCFIDVLARKAVRVTGHGKIVPKARAEAALLAAFDKQWGPYISKMSAFVEIAVSKAEMILSPAYDTGSTEAELRQTNLERLNAL